MWGFLFIFFTPFFWCCRSRRGGGYDGDSLTRKTIRLPKTNEWYRCDPCSSSLLLRYREVVYLASVISWRSPVRIWLPRLLSGCSSIGRVRALGAWSWVFESPHSDLEYECITGYVPVHIDIHGVVAEWFMALVLKTSGGKLPVGSNPTCVANW